MKGLLFLSGFFHIFGQFLYPPRKKYIYIESRLEEGGGRGGGRASIWGWECTGSLEGHCRPPRLY